MAITTDTRKEHLKKTNGITKIKYLKTMDVHRFVYKGLDFIYTNDLKVQGYCPETKETGLTRFSIEIKDLIFSSNMTEAEKSFKERKPILISTDFNRDGYSITIQREHDCYEGHECEMCEDCDNGLCQIHDDTSDYDMIELQEKEKYQKSLRTNIFENDIDTAIQKFIKVLKKEFSY